LDKHLCFAGAPGRVVPTGFVTGTRSTENQTRLFLFQFAAQRKIWST
jgi:hypothetical protein